jgi:hypothetical protein
MDTISTTTFSLARISLSRLAEIPQKNRRKDEKVEIRSFWATTRMANTRCNSCNIRSIIQSRAN